MQSEINYSSLDGNQTARQTSGTVVDYEVCIELLKAVARLSGILLSSKDLDCSVNESLKILGTSVAADRLTLLKHCNDPTGKTLGSANVRYEWLSELIKSQIAHPRLSEITYDGIETGYHSFCMGQPWGGLIDTLPEPFRSGQLKLGVKATYAIPITVEAEYWGIIGLDFCQSARLLQASELEILKTAASCIGSAVVKEYILQERETMRQTVLVEQQKARELEQQSNRLLAVGANAARAISTEENFDRAIEKALQTIGEGIDTDRVSIMEHINTAEYPHGVRSLYEWDSAYARSQIDSPVNRVSYEGIEHWHELMCQGKWAGGAIDDLPEPFRSKMQLIEVKSTYAIPILVEGKYWGIVGIDNCRHSVSFQEAEISILTTIAAFIGGAIAKERNRCARESVEKAMLIEREQAALERASSLFENNQTLSLRDKWLEATAKAANKLLEIVDLDCGINAALEVLGKNSNCDRVTVLQHFDKSPGQTNEYVKLLYEWDSLGTLPQISHPQLKQVSAKGIEDWFATLQTGGWIGGTIDELKEPFRSGQIELGVKATYSVPIFMNNAYWGAICIDFCRQPRRLTSPEISVFQTAASCIGSAIYRQQIQQDKERAELAVLDERNRMAREIHDTLAQAFTGISLQLEAAKNILVSEPKTAETRIRQAKRLAKEGIIEARRSVRALRPKTLEFNSLAIALQQLLENMTLGVDMVVKTSVEEELQLAPEMEVDLYRIAQEAVTNTLRHAKAKCLSISLTREEQIVTLQVRDNGKGFNVGEKVDRSFGLIGMQERCDRHHGSLSINSALNLGTEIIVTIPI